MSDVTVATKTKSAAGTLHPIELDLAALAVEPTFKEFAANIVAECDALRSARADWFQSQQRSRSWRALGARRLLVLFGTLAALATAVAAAFRVLAPEGTADQSWLVGALFAYAAMGAVSYWDKASDNTGAYFRQVAASGAVRDLWTRFEFEVLKLLSATASSDPGPGSPERTKLIELASGFSADLDAVASGESTEWRQEFQASMSALAAAAKSGSDGTSKELAAAVAEDRENARKERERVEKLLKEAEARAAGVGLAHVNVNVSGDFTGEVSLLVDGREAARTRLKQYPIDCIEPGIRRIQAVASKDGQRLEAATLADLKAGLNQLELTLT